MAAVVEYAGDVAIGGRVGANGLVEWGGAVVLHGGKVAEGAACGQWGGGRVGVSTARGASRGLG